MNATAMILILILAVYVILIVQLILGFNKVAHFEKTEIQPKTGFSIVIPFRNEAKSLPELLQSIANLNYPRDLFELILVDDFSKDNSERIYISWRIRNDDIDTTLLENLQLSNSPKKDAIARAIPIVKHDWIITTDGDCRVNEDWLLTLDNYIRHNQSKEMLVGAVVYQTKNNWFHHFQQLELLALQGTTIGSFGIGKPFMCNGANFAYTKKFFNELGGFGGINSKAGGDDVLLLQKAVKNDVQKIAYVKSVANTVRTKPENDLFKLFLQRVRWAGKTTGYSSVYAKILAVVVLSVNLGLVAGFGLSVDGKLEWEIVFGVFTVKYLADCLLLLKTNAYLRKGKFLLPLASSLIYPVFSSLVGLYSLFFGFTWKGRRFKK